MCKHTAHCSLFQHVCGKQCNEDTYAFKSERHYMYLIASSGLVTRMSNKDERYYKIPFQQKTE